PTSHMGTHWTNIGRRRLALENARPQAAMTPCSMRLRTGSRVQRLARSSPRLVELDRPRTWPLSELLDELLGRPYVIAVAEIEGALHWLIDARRLKAGAT